MVLMVGTFGDETVAVTVSTYVYGSLNAVGNSLLYLLSFFKPAVNRQIKNAVIAYLWFKLSEQLLQLLSHPLLF